MSAPDVARLAALRDEMRSQALVEKREANGRDAWALLEAGAAAIDELLAEAPPTAALREALKRLEWCREKAGWTHPVACCPACSGVPVPNFLGYETDAGPQYEVAGHKDNCWLRAALARAEGEPPNIPFYDALEELADEAGQMPLDCDPRAWQDLALRFADLMEALKASLKGREGGSS